MKTISVAMASHIVQETTSLCMCWRVTRQDGAVLAFTNLDRDLVFDGDTYEAASGYTPSETQTNSELNPDMADIEGLLVSPSITEDDLRAGLWDFAAVEIFRVNYDDPTMGRIWQRVGHLGEVTLDRAQFKATLAGLLQAYSTSILELTSPGCRANLGDARCKVDLTPFTVTGTIEAANVDGVTLYDSARVEAGPTGGVDILDVSSSDPGVVTTDGAHGLTEGQQISISGVVGPEAINVVTVALNVSEDAFELSVDTTDTDAYQPYVSGGVVTPFGNSGYFDHGAITFTSGANDGLSFEVKAYVPGQITLFLPTPYQTEAGDTYSMHAGCDKLRETCRDRFNNIVNMRAEPDLPGMDAMIQQGRHK